MIAARDLPAGITIQEADIRIVMIPLSDLPPDTPRRRSDVFGHKTLVPIPKGKLISLPLVGIVVKDRRLIYVNGFLPDEPSRGFAPAPCNYCDGGSLFWGVVYDPKTQEFSELLTNGLA